MSKGTGTHIQSLLILILILFLASAEGTKELLF